MNPAKIHQDRVDRAVAIQHCTHNQKGNELRNGNRKDEAESPERFALRVLAVDNKTKDHAEDVVKSRCENRPDDRPCKDAPELTANITVQVQDPAEILQSVPVKEDEVIAFFGVGRKRHTDHEDQRQDVEAEDTQHRERHQGDVNIPVEEILQVLAKARNLMPVLEHDLAFVGLFHLENPEDDERHRDEDCRDAVKKDQERIIARRVLVDLFCLIPDLLLFHGSQGRQHADGANPRRDHEINVRHLNGQYNNSLDHLLVRRQTCAHDDHRELGPDIAFCNGVPETVRIILF